MSTTSRASSLSHLCEEALEVPDIPGLAKLLTRDLPRTLRLGSASLLVWDRRLDSFEDLTVGETQGNARRSEGEPRARYLLTEGQLLETPGGEGLGTLVPLMARSGLVGMLVLGERRTRREPPYSPREARLLSTLAGRSALAVENHAYQKELIASERMAALGTMAGMLAHDFRGPMTVIRGYAELLLDPAATHDDIQQRARTIVETVDRLERMTQETLDFARGSERLTRRPVPIGTLVEELAAGVAEEFPGLEVDRRVDVPDDARASLDVDKLRRVVGNIAANALDAMGGRGRFHVRARLAPAEAERPVRLVLELADEGPGVPPEIRERLFDPFVTHGKKRGTGLGLAVAKRFVEDHAGLIDLEPGGPGACFRLELPLDAPPRETSA